MIWFEWSFGPFDLIWHIVSLRDLIWFDAFFHYVIWFDSFLTSCVLIWFDDFLKSRDLLWFDDLFHTIWFEVIWICEITIDPIFDSKRGFRRNQWHQWQELAESFRSVPYLSMKPQFWPDYGLILVAPEILIWNQNQIMIWFDANFLPKIMIWFDLTPCKNVRDLIWFHLRWSRFCVDLIWFEFAHPWSQIKHKWNWFDDAVDKSVRQTVWPPSAVPGSLQLAVETGMCMGSTFL